MLMGECFLKRYKYYMWAIFIYVTTLSVYIYNGYHNESMMLRASIDKELIQAAKSVEIILENDFHSKLINKNSVSPEEDMKNIKRLSKYTAMTEIDYIYSFILDGDIVRFASSSATQEELDSNEGLSHYFDKYDSVTEKLKNSFHENQINFEEEEDEWGKFRSVLISLKTSNGEIFVVGADMQIDFISKKLNELLFKSFLEALFYTAILIPFFIAFWLENKKINTQLEETIQIRTKQLEESKEHISKLLNNADQGFLSFSNDFVIDLEYSQACKNFFTEEPAGKNIADLLFTDVYKKELFIEIINDALSHEDETTTEYILGLLPSEISLNSKILKIEYKLIDKIKCMLILTDVTETKALEKKIKKEQKTLKMIVEIVSDSEIFFDTKKDYEKFISSFKFYIDENRTPLKNLSEIYRIIHTFKGAFSQFYMENIVNFLHELESKLTIMIKEHQTSNQKLLSVLENTDFKVSLNEEIKTVTGILGEEFFNDTNYIKVNSDSLYELQKSASFLLRNEKQLPLKHKDICEKILNLSKIKLINLLRPYNNLVNQLSQRLGKDIYDFKVIGDSSIEVTSEYKPFVKSLMHVFRNCIDHGIEDPETRVEKDKDEKGTIICNFQKVDNTIEIMLSDDGDGIDKEKILNKALKENIINQDEARNLNDDEILNLIFVEQFSTKEEISHISGRGVGMSALKTEIQALKGKIEIRSQKDIGTTFVFTLPYEEA